MKMKITYSILSVLFVAMFVLTSCHIEDNPVASTPVNGDEPIEFSSVYASVDTKTTTGENSALPANFQVWASRTVNSNTNYNVFGENGTTVTNTGSADSPKWTYSPVRYWQSGDYNFVAVTPADFPTSGELTSNGLELSFGTSGWDLSANQTDLLLATTHVDNTSGTPGSVNLAFNHILAKISFAARKTTTAQIEIISIKISGHHKIASDVKVSGSKYYWEFEDDGKTAQEIISSTAHTLTTTSRKITPDILVFPEDCILTLEVNIRHNTIASPYQKTVKIDGTCWLSGKQYDYIINVSPGSIVITSPQVKDWVTDINGNNENDDDIIHDFE